MERQKLVDRKHTEKSIAELQKLNPDIREVEIGVKALYKLTIYPLSFGQQFALSDTITEAVVGFYQTGKEMTDIGVVTFMVNVLKENAGVILEYVTDPDEVSAILEDTGEDSILNLITNKQVFRITEILYKDNYESLSKKVKDLFRQIQEDQLSERSSADSSEDTPSSDLEIYSESPTEKEDLQ